MTQTIEQLTARVRELEAENERLKDSHFDRIGAEAEKRMRLREQLAASQAYAKQLREALDELVDLMQAIRAEEYKPDSFTCHPALKALALPRDTSALDAYVAEKVKEVEQRLARRMEDIKLQAERYVSLQTTCHTLTRQRDNLMQQAQQHAMEARTANATLNEIYQLVSRATGEKANWNGAQPVREKLESLTRQRDLAVGALDVALENLRPHGDNCFVSNNYEGDPGAGCNCGIDGVTDYLVQTLAAIKESEA